MATPIFPVSIILSIVLGVSVNILLYKILKRNLIAFLLSLLGVSVLGELLKGIINSTLSKGPASIGAAFGTGIGAALAILIGVNCYTIASLGTSVHRWRKNKSSIN